MKKRFFCLTLAICLLMVMFIGTSVSAAGAIKLSKTEYYLGETMEGQITGLTEEEIEEGAYIVIAEPKSRASNVLEWLDYVIDLPVDNTFEYTAPRRFGDYELRVFLGDNSLFASVIFSVVPKKAGPDDIKLSKTSVLLKEKMTVQVSGLTDEEIENNAYIAVARKEVKPENSGWLEYVASLPANNIYEFEAPNQLGDYEIRVFYGDGTLYGAAGFTVTHSVAQPGDITLSKIDAAPGETMSVTVKGLSQGEIDLGAVISYGPAGTKYENLYFLNYISSLPIGDICTFTAPMEPGVYEIHVYCKDYISPEEQPYAPDYALFGKVSFSVGGVPIVDDLAGVSGWALPEVTYARDLGLTTDKVLSDFQQPITREEFCELVVKLYEKMSGNTAQPAAANPFKDTSNTEILKAYNLGIVNGTGPDTFSPTSSITREQIAVMFVRALKKVMPELDTESAVFSENFHDASAVSSWAVQDLEFLNAKGIFKGSSGYILPKSNTTREQAIALVKRVYEQFSQI